MSLSSSMEVTALLARSILASDALQAIDVPTVHGQSVPRSFHFRTSCDSQTSYWLR